MADNWNKLTGGNPTPPPSAPTPPKPGAPAPADNWDKLWGATPSQPQGEAFKPAQDPSDIVANMPNADKLTPLERGIYAHLPGFSQSTVGKALAAFGDSWVGKALNVLDVGAEGIERTVGLAVQYRNLRPGEEWNLKDAWYAGSLTGDMTNLPTFKRDASGKIVGMQIPNDLPGAAGLAQARVKIAKLVAGGMSEHDALVKTRDEYYGDLGALALRAQLNDTYFHVVADPLNYIMPALKPVEALQARRVTALTSKVAYSAEELAGLAEKATKAAQATVDVTEAAKFTEEAARLTELSGKVASGEVQGLNRLDKFAIMLTGGDPLATPQGKIANLLTKPLQLTPESKAKELLNMVNNNLASKIVAQLWDDPDAVNKIGDAISRAAKGSTGVEFGHAFLTTEGRTVQGFLGGADTIVNKIREDFNALEEQRGLIQIMKEATGENPEKLLKLAEENPQVLEKILAEKAAQSPQVAELAQRGELTADKLSSLAKIVKDMPYDKETAIVHMLGAVEEQAARQAIIQFGVEKNSLLTRWSGAVKSAESLFFMRMNPGYILRNAVNNEVTMISRGVFGLTEKQALSFWDDMGFMPKRLTQSVTMTEDVARQAGKGEKVIQEATRVQGKLEDFKRFVNDLQLGKANVADMTKYSARMEQSAGTRAFTKGFQQFFHQFWKPPQLEDTLDGATMDAIDKIDPELSRAIDNAVKSSYGSKQKLEKILGGNLHMNPQSVIQAASDKIGMDVSEILDEEILGHITQNLPDAIQNNKLESFIHETRRMIEDHVDRQFDQTVQDIVDNTAAQVQAGGPQMFYRKISDASDAFWGAHIEHSIKSPGQWEAFREAKSAKDWARASSIAERNLADDQKFFERAFKRVDAYLSGLEKGTAETGLEFPKEVRGGFKDFQRNWREFFDFRNSEYKRINSLPWEDRAQEYNKLQGVLDERYKKAIDFEDEVMQRADDAVGNLIQDEGQRRVFTSYRDRMAQLTRQDKESVVKMWQKVRNAPPDQRAELLNAFWSERKARLDELRQTDRAGIVAMQGEPNAAQFFEQTQAASAQPMASGTAQAGQFNVFDVANEYKIPAATEGGVRNDRRVLNIVNKYAPEGTPKFKSLQDVPEEIARRSFEGYQADKAQYVRSIRTPAPPAIADVKAVVPDLQPLDLGLSELSQRQFMALDAVVEGAGEQGKKMPAILDKLPPELRDKVMQHMDSLDSEFSSARLAATRYGEFRRDSALLNYARRTNFDAGVANVFPYAFWTTNSMMKWAVESIDRPAMLTTYLRMKKFLETAGAPQSGFPSRFKDNIRVHLPFAPGWMGDQFIDPLRLALPFDAFAQPIEQYQKNQLTVDGRSERTLDTMLQSGQITKAEYTDALKNHSGPAWDQAKNTTLQNDESLKMDTWDFANLMSSPHAPLQWAYNAASGHPEDIGPFTPMARTSRQIATLLGVDDYVNSGWNVEGKLRKSLGLPAFDKWEDYRIDREISNMAGTGEYTMQQVKEAMAISSLVAQKKIDPEQAKQNPLYNEAVKRSNISYTGGKSGAVLGLLGLKVNAYPVGEENLRALSSDFSAAYQKYKTADQSLSDYLDAHPNATQEEATAAWEKANPKLAKDASALTDFFDKNPQYEARLGLWDKPEDRLKKFMVDSLWSQWNSLPKLTKDELQKQLGSNFNDAFLNKDTRSYDALSPEEMQMYLKLMGGKEMPGMLTADQKLIENLFSGQLQTTDPQTAWRAQTYYDTRKAQFADYYNLQKGYYDLTNKSAQRKYLGQHPELKQYWDWRRDYLTHNPDLVPYLTDDPKQIARAQKTRRNPGLAVPNAQEIQANISPAAQRLLQGYHQNGEEMPPEMEQYVSALAQQYGMPEATLKGILGLQ